MPLMHTLRFQLLQYLERAKGCSPFWRCPLINRQFDCVYILDKSEQILPTHIRDSSIRVPMKFKCHSDVRPQGVERNDIRVDPLVVQAKFVCGSSNIINDVFKCDHVPCLVLIIGTE